MSTPLFRRSPLVKGLTLSWGPLVLGALFGTAPAHARGPIALQATSERDAGAPASMVWNLHDGREDTRWCTANGDRQRRAVFVFAAAQDVSVVRIVPSKTDAPLAVRVGDGTGVHEVPLDGQPVAIGIDPALHTRRVVVQLVGGRKNRSGALCLAELSLETAKGPVEGKATARALRGHQNASRAAIGVWVDDQGAPERTLELRLDGSFRFRYRPFLDGKPATQRGTWRWKNDKLVLSARGKSWTMPARTAVTAEGGGARQAQLTLSGDGPHTAINATYTKWLPADGD